MVIPFAAIDIALAVIAFAIVLIPAIIIHELGHFFAAKLVGISVLEFGLGFPPRLRRLFLWRETEFTLNLIPLGGFVRPLGENMIGPASEDKVKRDRVVIEHRRSGPVRIVTEREMLRLRGVDEKSMKSVNDARPLARIFFMAAGAMANFASAMLLFVIVALIGLSLPVGGLSQVAAVPPGSLFADLGVAAGDAIERIDGQRFADFAAFHDALAAHPGERIEFSMIRAADGESYQVIAPADFSIGAGFVQITGIVEDSPAEAAGLQPGDLVERIAGQAIPSSGDPASALSQAAEDYAGRQLPLTILRELEDDRSERLDIQVAPRVNPPAGQGRLGLAIRSQFGLADATRFANAGYVRERIPQSLPNAIAHSLRTTAETFKLIASIPGMLLDGSLSGEDARPISIIGISIIGGEFLQRSLQEGPQLMLNFIALISIFLGISNLLPIPALDGGRIVFVLLEMLRGKPVNPKLEGIIHMLGITLLMLLGVVIMLYDLINPPSIG